MSTPVDQSKDQANNGFFINNGTFSGSFTTPDGDVYDIRKLEPREVTDPRDGTISTIWGGYASARDRTLAAKDAQLQAEFKDSGKRPAELFAPEARDIPLYVTLRNRPGKGYTDIGSFWNAKGRYTVLARDLSGKSGLRFGGNVLAWKSAQDLEAERAARAGNGLDAKHDADLNAAERARAFDVSPTGYVDHNADGDAARDGAGKRAAKARGKAPTAEA